MKKNLALTIINVVYIIFVGWFIYFTNDMNNVASIMFLLLLDLVLWCVLE